MNQAESLCPGCKGEVVFQNIGGSVYRCPRCGFQYQLSVASESAGSSAASAAGHAFMVLLKVFFFMVALVVVGLGVAFAGCALMRFH